MTPSIIHRLVLPGLHLQLGCRAVLVVAFVFGMYSAPLAQVGISANGATPDPAALLDVNADALPANAKKGLLLPRVPLTAMTWQTLTAPFNSGGPFEGHGSANMPQSLLFYNTNTVVLTNQFAQFSVTPGLHSWDGSAAATPNYRWLRHQTKILPVQLYTTTATTTIVNDSWTTVTGLTSVSLNLRAGDRVLYSATGAFRLTPPVAPATVSGFATASARMRVLNSTTATTTTLKQSVASSMNDASVFVGTSGCILFNTLCAGNSDFYTTTLRLQSWRLIGSYDIPSDGVYTFFVEGSKPDGSAISVQSGGTASTNPDLRGSLSIEVIRP